MSSEERELTRGRCEKGLVGLNERVWPQDSRSEARAGVCLDVDQSYVLVNTNIHAYTHVHTCARSLHLLHECVV